MHICCIKIALNTLEIGIKVIVPIVACCQNVAYVPVLCLFSLN